MIALPRPAPRSVFAPAPLGMSIAPFVGVPSFETRYAPSGKYTSSEAAIAALIGALTSSSSVPAFTSAICAAVMKSKTDTDSCSLLVSTRTTEPTPPSRYVTRSEVIVPVVDASGMRTVAFSDEKTSVLSDWCTATEKSSALT